MNKIGVSLKAERELKRQRDGLQDLTQSDVSKSIGGFGRSSLSNWENGHTENMSAAALIGLSKYYGLNPFWLFDGTGEKYDNNSPCLKKAHNLTPKNQRTVSALIQHLLDEQELN